MPQVPVYGDRVRTAPLQPVAQSTPDVSSGAQAVAQGLGVAAEVADRAVVRAAQTEAWEAQAEINRQFIEWQDGERRNSMGRNAQGFSQRVTDWWEKTRQEYDGKLSPMAKQAIGRTLATVRNSALESSKAWETQQLDIGERSALERSTMQLVGQAVSAGAAGAAPILEAVRKELLNFGASRGVDMEPQILRATTAAHTTIINQLMQRDPAAAERYFNANKDSIEPTRHDEITQRLTQLSALNDGENAATRIWESNVQQGDYRNPVDLFRLERLAREEFANDPTRRNAAISALRSRFQAWNQSQTEMAAGNIEAVYRMLGPNGTQLTPQILRSQEWNALPAPRQREITLQLEQQAAARSSRAMAEEGRALQRLQRQQITSLLTNADKYLEMSDPRKLATMTRDEVRSTLSVFGMQGTQQLLERWDALQKPGKAAEARMDQDDFNAVADRMQLRPFDPKKTEDERRALGELKFRVEQMIDAAQRNARAPLTREQKMELMREEMARTVTINPGLFSFSREVPVITMTPEQLRQVVIPAAERPRVAAALREMNREFPGDPRYAPTEDNMRRLFAEQRSPAARLIGTQGR